MELLTKRNHRVGRGHQGKGQQRSDLKESGAGSGLSTQLKRLVVRMTECWKTKMKKEERSSGEGGSVAKKMLEDEDEERRKEQRQGRICGKKAEAAKKQR
ncbi:hypothetical protein Q3G72_010530 [Acer saccharum]|nr:hypothetical protein Q3G72_010530 [Acer saccharum]